MARYFKRKKGEILLVVMLLLDFTIGSPLPPPTSGPRIADKTTNHAGQSEEDTTVLSKPDDDLANNLQAKIEHIFEGAIQSTEENETEPLRAEDLQAEIDPLMGDSSQSSEDDENDLSRGKTSEEEDDEFNKEAEYVISQREQLVTDDLEMRTLQIMQDVDDYNNKVQNIGDVRETIRARCGQDVMSAVDDVLVNLGEDQDVMTVLTTVALLQLHQCPSAALDITSRLVTALENRTTDDLNDFDSEMTDGLNTKVSITSAEQFNEIGKQPPGDQFPLLGTVDFCDHIEECKQTGIPLVRKELVHHPSLLALYDVSVAAVFTQTQNDAVANALIEDITGDLNITVAEGDLNITTHLRITKRSSCVDKKEAKAQSIISWIPFIGTIYNLISSAVYAGKGCKDVAKERAIEGAIDVAMDVATVLTAGAGSAAFQGVKAVVKGAGKQAAKAAMKTTLKKTVKTMAKETVKGYLNPFKGAYREAKDLVKGVVGLAKGATALAKKGGKAIKNGVKKLTKSGAKQVDNVNVKGIGKSAQQSKVHGVNAPEAHLRCRRAGYKRCRSPSVQERGWKKLETQFKARGSPRQIEKYTERWNELWNSLQITVKKNLPHGKTGRIFKNIEGIDLTTSDLTNKELFEALQQRPVTRMNVNGEEESVALYVKQQFQDVDVEYIVRRQYTSNQVLIQMKDPKGVYKASTYDDITTELDVFAQNTALRNKASELKETFTNAETLLDDLEKTLTSDGMTSGLERVKAAKMEVSELTERLKQMPKDNIDLASRRQNIPASKRKAISDIKQALNIKTNQNNVGTKQIEGQVVQQQNVEKALSDLTININIFPSKNTVDLKAEQKKVTDLIMQKVNANPDETKGIVDTIKEAVDDFTKQLDKEVNENAFKSTATELQKMTETAQQTIEGVRKEAGSKLQKLTDDLTESLKNKFVDEIDLAALQTRGEMAMAMRQAIYDRPGAAGNFGKVFNDDSIARAAASDFIVITQLAEAVPGRIPGIDGYFRAGLKKMAQKGWTFSKFSKEAGIVTGRGHLQHGKKVFGDYTEGAKRYALDKTGSKYEMVDEIMDDLSEAGSSRRNIG